jgi:type II secretory ATPase GspE/PulE/Tfp pilus assembly ATPase PilB-like protein
VTRLLDMGMDPFNFADALLAILAQRLVRRLCKECRIGEPAPADWQDELLRDHLHVTSVLDKAPAEDEVLADWMKRFGSGGHLTRFRSPGCDHCGGTGLRGRVGLHELLTIDRRLRELIQSGSRSDGLLKQGLANGMTTLRQDGIEKVLSGLTSIEEVRASS